MGIRVRVSLRWCLFIKESPLGLVHRFGAQIGWGISMYREAAIPLANYTSMGSPFRSSYTIKPSFIWPVLAPCWSVWSGPSDQSRPGQALESQPVKRS